MVTLKEIAQHCGVSVTTVSNIVNNSPKKVRNETRKKVMEAIEELGYHPNYFAQGLRRQRTQTIGVITEDLAQFTTPEIVEGIDNRMDHFDLCEACNDELTGSFKIKLEEE